MSSRTQTDGNLGVFTTMTSYVAHIEFPDCVGFISSSKSKKLPARKPWQCIYFKIDI